MKPETQRERNPFPFSDTNKRYHTYDHALRRIFGKKCIKITLDGGFTCPNIDGRCGTGGCIYCSDRGSGEFAPAALPIREQYRTVRQRLSDKWPDAATIAYFQAHTNTYAPVSVLRALFEEALTLPDVVGLSVATRADCLGDDVLDYLAELSSRTHLTVELGLQTVHDRTALCINRGHTMETFFQGYAALRARVPRARIGVHLILGLPGETDEEMLHSVRTVATLHPDEVKLHLLYVVKGTPLAALYERGEYTPLTMEHYVSLVVRALELLPPDVVIGRLTGDGEKGTLLAPRWSTDKRRVLNAIDQALYRANTFQGARFSCN